MIRRIQARNYRCLHHVDVALDRFHVLVGPNASGKSTLFDVVAFLSDFVSDGLGAAVEKRTRNFQDLVWGTAKDWARLPTGNRVRDPRTCEGTSAEKGYLPVISLRNRGRGN